MYLNKVCTCLVFFSTVRLNERRTADGPENGDNVLASSVNSVPFPSAALDQAARVVSCSA